METSGFEVEDQEDRLGTNLIDGPSGNGGMARQLHAVGLGGGRAVYAAGGMAVLVLITFIMSIAALAKVDNITDEYNVFYEDEYAHTKKAVSALYGGDASFKGCWYTTGAPGIVDYETGDVLMGEPLLEFQGHYYQVAGGNWASFTWNDAWYFAGARCHKGVNGKIATIESAAENAFLVDALNANAGHRAHDSAWIGLTDLVSEGTFVWTSNGVTVTTPKGDVPYQFTNWNFEEPSSNGEEDCVVMYDSGVWNDDSCYKHHPFFLIEFDTD